MASDDNELGGGTGASAETKDYKDNPRDWAKRWSLELAGAKKMVTEWHRQGEKIVKRFLDERDSKASDDTRYNLFSSNISTVRSIMYGKVPKVDVSRRFNDAEDKEARCAGEILERLLNTDIARATDGYTASLQHCLDDLLLVGLGNVRVRYTVDFETQEFEAITHPDTGEELAPAYSQEVKSNEDVEVDYVFWKDQLWSPARVFNEIRWWAFKAHLGKDELSQRFGAKMAKKAPMNAKKSGLDDTDPQRNDPWARAEVWEIWDKEHKQVFWYIEGMDEVLDRKDDPLGLDNFWPFPKPMMSNLTTTKFLPRPDFIIAQDIYNEIDLIGTRITMLERAVRVAGVYDKTAVGVQRLLTEAARNEMIPVDNWAMFQEKGGIRGQIDWLPLDQIVNALGQLRELQTELQGKLFQVTGMSDIVRGQATGPATATEQSIKAKFASVRLQAMQDEFARFASDIQNLKSEIIAKHFDEKTIFSRSNIQFSRDAQIAPAAIALLKTQLWEYRVEVKPEAVSLTDYAALKQERTEIIQGIAMFFQAATPLAQLAPQMAPFLMQMLQWLVAGLRGSSDIEAILDQAIAAEQQRQAIAAMQPPKPPPPDPKLEVEQFKAKAQQAHTQQELQSDLIRTHAEAQTQAATEQHSTKLRVLEDSLSHRNKLVQDIGKAIGATNTNNTGGGSA